MHKQSMLKKEFTSKRKKDKEVRKTSKNDIKPKPQLKMFGKFKAQEW